MTEVDLQKAFIERFKTLNEVSKKEYITRNNVSYPNKKIKVPENKRWFELYFISNPPSVAGICENAQNRYTGIFQIDICTPLDVGEVEANHKYKAIAKLFSRDTYFSDISVVNCYRALQKAEVDHYRTVVRIEWTADIDKE